MLRSIVIALFPAVVLYGQAARFPQNPLITLNASPTLGDNINGPALIRVPAWVEHPLGRYYLYFAHHKGDHIRLAYANALEGPWKIYAPGVLNVKDTIFFRPQPDPSGGADAPYTHVASPEVFVDEANKRLVMYVHGMYTEGKAWPADPAAARAWIRDNGYAQYSQTTISTDGLHFKPQTGITQKAAYIRVFAWQGAYYSMGRLGVLGRSVSLTGPFESGPSAFAGGPYADRVRHVGLLRKGETLFVFFSLLGAAPERILVSTMSLKGDWHDWRASAARDVLTVQEKWECADLPVVASRGGESDGPEHALRDPFVFEENGKATLFYSYCGEQGLAAADVTALLR